MDKLTFHYDRENKEIIMNTPGNMIVQSNGASRLCDPHQDILNNDKFAATAAKEVLEEMLQLINEDLGRA